MQRAKIGDAIDAEDHRFAVDNELLVSVLQRRLDDPRIALGPVVAAPRDQPHAIAVALDPQAATVIPALVATLSSQLKNRLWHSSHGILRRYQLECEPELRINRNSCNNKIRWSRGQITSDATEMEIIE
jgi:hypothetical protein